MKKSKLLPIILSGMIILTNNINVFANNLNANNIESNINSNLDINEIIENELNSFIIENDLNIKLSNFNFKINSNNENNINTELNKFIDIMKENLLKMSTKSYDQNINTYLEDRGSYYVSEVWSGVPSLGWGYIKQHFKANISNGKINSIEMLGNSYQDGLTYAKWTPNRSWAEISSSKRHVDIYMNGVLNYTLNVFEGGMEATFLEELSVGNNGRLEEMY